MMWQGKKNTAQGIFYSAMDKIRERTSDDPLKAFKKAVENAKPLLEVKTRRVGGADYQVPIEVPQTRRTSLAMRWISPTRGRALKREWRKSWRMSSTTRATCAAERSRRKTMCTVWRRQTRPSRITGR